MMKLMKMSLALLLGTVALVLTTSCGETKEPVKPDTFDGTYTVTSVKTTPSTIEVQGRQVDVQSLFLGDALMKLTTLKSIRIDKDLYVLIGEGDKTFPGDATQRGTLKVGSKGRLTMLIAGMPMEQPIGHVSLSGKQLTTDISIPGAYIGYFAQLYKASKSVPDNDPVLLALLALKDANQRVTIQIEATK